MIKRLILCLSALLVLFSFVSCGTEQPTEESSIPRIADISIIYNGTEIQYIISGNWDKGNAKFSDLMQKDTITYVPIGKSLEIQFSVVPKSVRLLSYSIYDDGRIAHDDERTGKEKAIDFNEGKAQFQVQLAPITLDMQQENVLQGYRLICEYGSKTKDYLFVLKTDRTYYTVAPKAKVLVNDVEYELSGILSEQEANSFWDSALLDEVTVRQMETDRKIPLVSYNDEIQFVFPKSPSSVKVCNDILQLVESKQFTDHRKVYKYQETLPLSEIKQHDTAISFVLKSECFSAQSDGYNWVRLTCTWDEDTYVYTLGFRIAV